MDSEYLVTLLVVVPLALQPDWNNRVRMSMQRSLFLHSWPNAPLKLTQQDGKQGSSRQR